MTYQSVPGTDFGQSIGRSVDNGAVVFNMTYLMSYWLGECRSTCKQECCACNELLSQHFSSLLAKRRWSSLAGKGNHAMAVGTEGGVGDIYT